MLTIFSLPGPVTDKTRRSRRNAVNSWRRLEPKCEILLFGNEEGVRELAAEAGARHLPAVNTNEQGMPLLSDTFSQAHALGSGDWLMYSNCDMLYFDDLQVAIESVPFNECMLLGRRWDMLVPLELNVKDESAWAQIKSGHGKNGRWHGYSGMDFFIFPRALRVDMLPFVVGRPGWDGWLMWKMRDLGVPVVDATSDIVAIHQNHEQTWASSANFRLYQPDIEYNRKLAGGFSNMLSIREADWFMREGRVTRPPWPRRVLSVLATTIPYRAALAIKRSVWNCSVPSRFGSFFKRR